MDELKVKCVDSYISLYDLSFIIIIILDLQRTLPISDAFGPKPQVPIS
jgi:hypothetical protein